MPTTASVQVGQSQQFTATISGTPNTAVSWLVNGVLGGNSGTGTINSSGVYNAPSVIPGSTVTIAAQSVDQPDALASAVVTVIPPPAITVAISPTSASLQAGQTQQFVGTVSGTSNTGVTWLVNGVIGGTYVAGTVSSSGLYTAPSSAPSGAVTVTAQSVSDPTSRANATLVISPTVAHQVGLTWAASSSSVAGYNVYRTTQLTGAYIRINLALDTATIYTDSNVSSGQTYYYAVTSVVTGGAESSFSNVAQATIP